MAEWRPGLLAARLEEIKVEQAVKVRSAVAEAAAAVERQAKLNATNSGAHELGTPTPAGKGSGPAIISGTLRRSIVFTPPEPVGADEVESKVGMAAGVYPPASVYGKNNKTPSSRYAKYLETVWEYPFLVPALKTVVSNVAPGIWRKHFGTWKGGK